VNIELTPSLEKFIADKVKDGDYRDASEVVRDSLRRWRDYERATQIEQDWLEQEIQEGIDSIDLPPNKNFWRDLRTEVHREHKSRAI
jgi:antitoxin ParD1/3/4